MISQIIENSIIGSIITDIEDNEINRLATEFIAELNAGKLTLHNIANNLKEINTKNNLKED